MSTPAPFPPDEARRLQVLHSLAVMDTLPEQEFDDIVLIASQICGTPVSLLTLVDEERQWFKARLGTEATESSRDDAFCSHAILEPDRVMTVPDAQLDPRFADNPMVTGFPSIRFYAGAPIVADGHALGTVCVIDTQARTLSGPQEACLLALARQASTILRLRRLCTDLGVQR